MFKTFRKKSTFFVVFFKKIPLKIKIKKRIYVTQHCLMNMCSKFQVDIFNDLDLYWGHKTLALILTNVRYAIHGDLITLFALNIDILLAKLIKPEKTKILTLT